MKWIKRTLGLAIVLGLVAAATLAFLPKPLKVEAARVDRGPLEVSVEGTGKSRVRERYVVIAPVTGRLERIALRAGDAVTAGQPVALIAPPTPPLLDARTRAEVEARVAAAEAAEAQAQAAIDAAKLGRQQAHRERERSRDLVEQGTLTRQALDAAEFELRARAREVEGAELAAQTARRQVEAARSVLAAFEGPDAAAPEQVAVRAPAAGRVLRVYQENEGPVEPGVPLLEIGDPAALEAVVELVTADAVKIAPGTPVRLERWGGTQPLSGTVRLVEPSAFTRISALGIEEQRVNVVVEPAGDRAAWNGLGDGWRVEARFRVWGADSVLRVPGGALFRDGEAWAAFVVEGGRAVRRTVALGHRAETAVEVLGGLREGDRVILHPSDKLADGDEVEAGGE